MKNYLKSPVSYYGGKANLVSTILQLIPQHKIYTESFFGSGAVFFAKEPAESEVINDKNNLIMNFYDQCVSTFKELKQKVEATVFSRASYSVALCIWKMPHLFSKLQQAWAFYVGCNMGFASGIGSFGYDKYSKRVKAFNNKKMRFNPSVVDRLKNATIESNDACKVLETFDTPESFHYVDPPYIGTNCGSYAGYSESDYRNLLDTLCRLKGKFLLSSFPTDILTEYALKYGWYSIQVKKTKSAVKVSQGEKRKTQKIEVLTANYPISLSGL